ncbi:MAG: hypothetical protein ACP5XB_25280, partial [Isosphaeraceae bacterium]
MPKRLFKRGPLTAIPPGIKVVYEPAGHEKMSDVLDDFIEPYSDVADTEDAYRKLLMLGQMAWNTALLPDDERQVIIDQTLDAGFARTSGPTRAAAREFIETLVRRKLEHFAGNRRAILSFSLTDTGDGYHL